MAFETYSPNKTVTLKEDNPPFGEKLVAASSIKTDAAAASNNNYPAHKSITLTAEKNAAPASSNEVSITNKPSDKTESLSAEKTIVKAEENQKSENLDIQNKTVAAAAANSSDTNYPDRKTVNLGTETAAEKKEEKPEIERWAPVNNAAPASSNAAANNTYLSHKTINLEDKGTIEKKTESIGVNTNTENKSTLVKENETAPPPIKSSVTAPIADSKQIAVTAYPLHKSISLSAAGIPLTAAQIKENQPAAEKQETIAASDKNTAYYPPVKTAEITNEEKVTAENVKEKEAVSPEIKPRPEAGEKMAEQPGCNYPSHKSFSFIKEEIKVTSVNEGTAAVKTTASAAVKTIDDIVKTADTAAAKNIKQPVPAAPVKQKKPVLWIILTAFFFLTTAATAFFAYKQQHDLKEEVTQLKQSKEDLTDELKKFKKDIFIDDIITRGVKLNPKSDAEVVSLAAESEALRVCFSVTGNLNAQKGRKAVYIRLIAPDGKILTKGKEELLQYKGNKIPYSFKEDIDFKNQELMLCFDFKPDEKLVKGAYKAEIYNDGVMDGTASFELK